MTEFDMDRYLELSGPVQTNDIDYTEARAVGLTDTEARLLYYMSHTEVHTVIYLRDLLHGHSAADVELCTFLPVWSYEEMFHSRAIDSVLRAAGRPTAAETYSTVTRKASLREPIEAVLAQIAALSTPRFAALHMTWGSINELMTAVGYKMLAQKTANRPLATILGRIAKQERRHFSFYYNQAERRLRGDVWAQRLCKLGLRYFWTPPGSGVGHQDGLEFLVAHLFGDAAGREAMQEFNERIAALPGLQGFTRGTEELERLIANYERRHGPVDFDKAFGRPAALAEIAGRPAELVA